MFDQEWVCNQLSIYESLTLCTNESSETKSILNNVLVYPQNEPESHNLMLPVQFHLTSLHFNVLPKVYEEKVSNQQFKM